MREADDITELHTYYPHITVCAGQSQESTSSPVHPLSVPALLVPEIHTHTLHVCMSCLTLVVIAFQYRLVDNVDVIADLDLVECCPLCVLT